MVVCLTYVTVLRSISSLFPSPSFKNVWILRGMWTWWVFYDIVRCCRLVTTYGRLFIRKAHWLVSQSPTVTVRYFCPDKIVQTLPGLELVTPRIWGGHCATQPLNTIKFTFWNFLKRMSSINSYCNWKIHYVDLFSNEFSLSITRQNSWTLGSSVVYWIASRPWIQGFRSRWKSQFCKPRFHWKSVPIATVG